MNDTSDVATNSNELQEERWAKVAPIGIAYFFFKPLYLFITNGLVYLIPAALLQSEKLKQHIEYVMAGIVIIIALFLISAVLKYLFYAFRLSDERIEIRQGLIQKSHLDLPFEKIQNVKIEQPFYYRFHKYAMVELETAGSASKEANIVALKLENAEALKAKVLYTRQASENNTNERTDNTPSIDDEIVLNTRSIMDLVIHGITNNRIWILLGAAAPFYNPIVENIGTVMEAIGFDIAGYIDYNSQSLGMFVLHILSVVMFIMLFVVLISVIGSIFVFYNYRLSKQDERYIKRSGLITKQEVSMKTSRIQVATQQQDWLDILIGRANIKLEQNSSGISGTNQSAQLNNASKLIVPSVTLSESDDLIADVFKQSSINQQQYKHVSTRYILRLMIFPVVPLILALVCVAYLANFTAIGWFSVAFAIILMFGLSVLRWFRWGYHFSNNFVFVRKGLLGKNYSIFPIQKVQQTKYKQTIFMRPHKLATIQLVLASGAHSIPYVPDTIAADLIDESLLIVERDKPAWM